jgi:hypothetical protein
MATLRRSAIAAVSLAMIVTGGSALAGGGGAGGERPAGGSSASSDARAAQDDLDARRGRDVERLHLIGIQDPAQASLISVDGRVFTLESPVVQFPGTTLLVAALNGQNEVDESATPGAGDPNGSGTATVELTLEPPEVCVTLAVADIALPAAAAHIHQGAAGVNGPVVVPLPTPGEDGSAEGCVTEGVTTELVEAIAADPAGYYVNVHNATFPAGAVRGQLAQDPEAVVFGPGDRNVFREQLFALDDSDPANPEPTGPALGSVLAECTVVTTGLERADTSVLCSRMFVLDDRGDIAAAESSTFADPAEDTVAITGGTGDFRDAGGEISFTVEEFGDAGLLNSVYDVRLLHLG